MDGLWLKDIDSINHLFLFSAFSLSYHFIKEEFKEQVVFRLEDTLVEFSLS